MSTDDLIDRLAGVTAGSPALRREVARAQAQASHDALFSPVDDTDFPVVERELIAAFVTRLTADDAVSAHYAERAIAADAERARDVLDAATTNLAAGPYGVYAEPGLQHENVEGPRFTASGLVFGDRLAAALEHAHLLTYRPRETDGSHHDRLLQAGWNENGIVTLSQLVAFLAFQQRVVAGLSVVIAATAEVSA